MRIVIALLLALVLSPSSALGHKPEVCLRGLKEVEIRAMFVSSISTPTKGAAANDIDELVASRFRAAGLQVMSEPTPRTAAINILIERPDKPGELHTVRIFLNQEVTLPDDSATRFRAMTWETVLRDKGDGSAVTDTVLQAADWFLGQWGAENPKEP
jgi:hypothetical protein